MSCRHNAGSTTSISQGVLTLRAATAYNLRLVLCKSACCVMALSYYVFPCVHLITSYEPSLLEGTDQQDPDHQAHNTCRNDF